MTEKNDWFLRNGRRLLKYGILLAVPLFVFYAVMTGVVICDYTDRTRGLEMLSLASGVKQKIGDFMLANPGKPVQMDAKSLLPENLSGTTAEGERMQMSVREITSTGESRMFSPQIGVMFVLSPTVTGKRITWKCWGRPVEKVPAFCRA